MDKIFHNDLRNIQRKYPKTFEAFYEFSQEFLKKLVQAFFKIQLKNLKNENNIEDFLDFDKTRTLSTQVRKNLR